MARLFDTETERIKWNEGIPTGVSRYRPLEPIDRDTAIGALNIPVDLPEEESTVVDKLAGLPSFLSDKVVASADAATRAILMGGQGTAHFFYNLTEWGYAGKAKAHRALYGDAPRTLKAERQYEQFKLDREKFETLSQEGFDFALDFLGIPKEAETAFGRGAERFIGEVLIPSAVPLSLLNKAKLVKTGGSVVYQTLVKGHAPEIVARSVAGAVESTIAYSEFLAAEKAVEGDAPRIQEVLEAAAKPWDDIGGFVGKLGKISFQKLNPPKDPNDRVKWSDITADEIIATGFGVLGMAGGALKYRKSILADRAYRHAYKDAAKANADFIVREASPNEIAYLLRDLRTTAAKGPQSSGYVEAKSAIEAIEKAAAEVGLKIPTKVFLDISPNVPGATAKAQKAREIFNAKDSITGKALDNHSKRQLAHFSGPEVEAQFMREYPEVYGKAREAFGTTVQRRGGLPTEAPTQRVLPSVQDSATGRMRAQRVEPTQPAGPTLKQIETGVKPPPTKVSKITKPTPAVPSDRTNLSALAGKPASVPFEGGIISGPTTEAARSNIANRIARSGQTPAAQESLRRTAISTVKRYEQALNNIVKAGNSRVRDAKGRITNELVAGKYMREAYREQANLSKMLVNARRGDTLVMKTGHSVEFVRNAPKGNLYVRYSKQAKPTLVSYLQVKGQGIKGPGMKGSKFVKEVEKTLKNLQLRVVPPPTLAQEAKEGLRLSKMLGSQRKFDSKGNLIVSNPVFRRGISDSEGLLDPGKLANLSDRAVRALFVKTQLEPARIIERKFGAGVWASIVKHLHTQEVRLFQFGKTKISSAEMKKAIAEGQLEKLTDISIDGLEAYFNRFTRDELKHFYSTLGKPKSDKGLKLKTEGEAYFKTNYPGQLAALQEVYLKSTEAAYVIRKRVLKEAGIKAPAKEVEGYILGDWEPVREVITKEGKVLILRTGARAKGATSAPKLTEVRPGQDPLIASLRREILKRHEAPADSFAAGLELKDRVMNPFKGLRVEIAELTTLEGELALRESLLMGKNSNKYVLVPRDSKGRITRDFNKLPAYAREKGHEWRQIKDAKHFEGYFFHPDLAAGIENLVSANKVSASRALRTVRNLNHQVRVAQFAASMFHQLSITKAAFTDEVLFAWLPIRPKAFGRSIKSTFGHVGFTKNDPLLKNPNLKEYINLGGGHKTSAEAQAQEAFETVMGSQKLSAFWKPARAAVQGITYLPKNYTSWLFNKYIPKLKFLKYEQHVLRQEGRLGRRLTDAEKINVIKEGQNFYGEMNERLFGRSGTATSVLRLFFTAPGFAEGNMRSIFTAVGAGWVGNKEAVKMGWRSRNNVINSLSLTLTTASIGTRLFTGRWPDTPKTYEDVRNLFSINTGQEDERGNDLYVDLLYQDRDYFELLLQPAVRLAMGQSLGRATGKTLESWKHRFSGMLARTVGMGFDAASIAMGKEIYDWKGHRVFSITDRGHQKILKFLQHELGQVLPISFQVFHKATEQDQNYMIAGIAAVAGLRPVLGAKSKLEYEIKKLGWGYSESRKDFFRGVHRLKSEKEMDKFINTHNKYLRHFIDTFKSHFGEEMDAIHKKNFERYIIDKDEVFGHYAENFGSKDGTDIERFRRIHNVLFTAEESYTDLIKRMISPEVERVIIGTGLYEVAEFYKVGKKSPKTLVEKSRIILPRLIRFDLEKAGELKILNNREERDYQKWRRSKGISDAQSDYFQPTKNGQRVDWRGVWDGKVDPSKGIPKKYLISTEALKDVHKRLGVTLR